ncbi:hypothetical protein V2E39_07635 [Chryseobacterium arthrosphaerae]|uniref:Uncharacterized protein n=1 Tax=Chryseobacterium arthrosphaerae TaxID=651561 RepID=A0A1B8ZVG6_9FLAO|nr:hypothetical protein [Chryseobacterium arthrosphaerae]OCA75582.1 hypothetical protein BBI00_15155 [Chryseobacterium arthrosphaerae]QUY54847.1 hypothetical protein I2F65_18505 [Chryseobacterium arthrosphaerae]HAT92508.1 hypothetical protein [Sphingobacterium sp.]
MKKDQLQDKYDEIFRDIREEKMDWSFEDFLQKAEGEEPEKDAAPIIPLGEKKKPSFPKWFWMAASVMLIFGIGFFFNNKNTGTDVQDRETLVKNEILKQKSGFLEENSDHQEQVAVNHTDSISGTKKDSVFQENQVAEKDVLDEILPKRGRLKKETRPRYVDNTSAKNNKNLNDSTAYDDSYVIVNGKRISSEKEAIDVTKYSFMKLGSEFKKTVASSQKNENFDSEY